MPSKREPKSIVGRRLRERREALDLSQEQVGVAIGLDEATARARISRYELGVHEPPYQTVRMLARVLGAPVAYLYTDEEALASLLLALQALPPADRTSLLSEMVNALLKRERLAGAKPSGLQEPAGRQLEW